MHTKPPPAVIFAVATVALSLTLSGPVRAADPIVQAKETLNLFLEKDPGLRKFVESSAGYAIFPSVKKGAIGVGGARGEGSVFQRGGTPVAKVTLTQVTVGLQLGGQTYSEVIFFENPKVFNDFLTGEFSLAAQISAVALAEGASKSARYQNGVAVFTATNSGLMFEASVGGQKFGIKPFK